MEELIKEEAKQEEVQENKTTTNEEKPVKTYTEEEVLQIKKNAIAEGMRKATKQQETQSNEELENLKTSLSEKDTLIAEKDSKMEELNQQITAFKNAKLMDDLGVDKTYQEIVFKLIQDSGEEVNETTISEIMEKYPKFKADNEIGIEYMGQTKPQANPYDEAKAKEEEEIKKKFQF